MHMLLEVKDLTVQYAHTSLPAIEHLNLQIQAGEALGLVGESGCGKSTLGRSLLKLLPDQAQMSGQVSLAGKESDSFQAGAWRGEQIALIFQDPMTRLDPMLTIADHGLEVLRSHYPQLSHRAARQKFAEALISVRIDAKRADQYPHEFSGGMRQRVAIALALLLDPVLLIADEPTTSLDVTVAAEILSELTQLRQQRGMGLLLITHDLGLVAKYCDRIAVMYGGTIVEVGKSSQILQQPHHPYTKSLLSSVIHFDSTPSIEIPEKPQTEKQVLVRVQNLCKYYNKSENPFLWLNQSLNKLRNKSLHKSRSNTVRAIDHISFEIQTGDRFGIIGESGSGKSSTARAILQLIVPDSGSVQFNQTELTKLKAKELRQMRSQMQMIFQDPRASLNPHRLIWQSVADPLIIHGMATNMRSAKEQVIAMLARVGIDQNLIGRLPKELSGGQLQRVAIARALITKPRFLICDEPVSMLDATIQNQILDLMLELQQEFQLTYLFITHDLAVAKFFCDRLAVMQGGKIVEQGITSQIFAKPQHPYTQKLLQSIANDQ